MDDIVKCKTCRFWDKLTNRWSYDYCNSQPLENYGACTRYPPQSAGQRTTLYLEITEPDGVRHAPVTFLMTEFPITNHYDWCGEHRT